MSKKNSKGQAGEKANPHKEKEKAKREAIESANTVAQLKAAILEHLL